MASHQKIAKITKITEQSVTLREQEAAQIETATLLKLAHCDLKVQVSLGHDGTVSAKACLMDGSKFWRTPSKHTELALTRRMGGWQRESLFEGCLYIHKRRPFMKLAGFRIPEEGKLPSIVQLYHRLLAKNILIFEKFLQGARVTRRGRLLPDPWSEQQQSLQLADALRTTRTNIGISEAKSEFMFAKRSFAEQSEQLAGIEKNILEAGAVEHPTGQLYSAFAGEASAGQLREQLVPAFQKHIKRLKSLLLLKEPEEKRIEDYNYNVVRVAEVRHDADCQRPIGEGASSTIHAYRMLLIYTGSYDEGNLPPPEEVERVVAVKRARQGHEGKRDKIAHEQQIVSKLKNITSPFLPKYFAAAPAAAGLGSCLLMEMLPGEELDYYAALREETLSAGTKLQLLLNVVQGLRHLHGCGVVHLDLKPINIMVERGLITKLIDFGDAHHRDVCSKTFLPGFSFPWVAPEVCQRFLRLSLRREDALEFSEKQDVFALGFVIAELFFGTRVLYLGPSKFQQVWTKREVLQRVFYAAERGAAFGEDLVVSTLGQLVVRCLDPDPEGRPRVEWIGITLRLLLNSILILH